MNKFTNLQLVKEYVREHSDLVKLIEDDVGSLDWKEESGDVLVCCSPFREENNPSFKVSRNKFKDWGGEQYSGDIFSWAQIWHNLSFIEAIEYVANRFNIDLSSHRRSLTDEEKQLQRYIKLNKAAAAYLHQLFRENTIVRDNYLSRSGFTLKQVEPYEIGYCPDKDLLVAYLSRDHHISMEDIERLEFYRKDLFNNAIIYPIHNYHSEVIGFYSKQLVDGAVYKGTKHDHPLRDSSVLYGFHVARKNIRKNEGQLVIVEGQRDAIAIGAVACMGSSVSDKQLDSLRDYKIRKIIACYDGDYTGWIKSLEMVNKPPILGNTIILIARPELDLDPHEMWLQGGDEAIYRMLKKAELPIEHYVRTKFGDITGKLSYVEKQTLLVDIHEFLTKASGVQLNLAAKYLSEILDSTQESIIDYIAEIKVQYSELFNLEAERTLIAACMSSVAAFSTARSAGIEPTSFTLSYYKKLFEATIIAHEKFADNYSPQNVLDESMARWADPSLPEVVQSVLKGDYKYSESAACDIVLDMWRRRMASEQAKKLVNYAQDLSTSFAEIVNTHRKNLISTVSSAQKQARTPKDLAKEFLAELKERNESGGNVIIGHSLSCLPSIDAVLGGVQKHYTVIAGDSGAGKSMLGMNFLKCLAIDANAPTLWIGQEMHSKENTMRLVSILTGVDNTRLQTGNISKKEAEKVMVAYETIIQSGYYMARPAYGHIDEVLSIIDEYRWKYDIQAIIWDYIQLITTGPGQERWSREQVIGHASTMIKNKIVGDMGLACIIIAQMNRDRLSSGQHKIAGSYRIIQDCDNFLWIEKKSKKQIAEDGEGKGNRYIQLGKRRGGVSDIRINAKLHIDPGSASLLISDCSPPSDLGKLYVRNIAA